MNPSSRHENSRLFQSYEPYSSTVYDGSPSVESSTSSSPPLFPPAQGAEKDETEASLEDRLDREIASMNSTNPDYYAVLNLERNASDQQVKDEYRRLSMIFHPDKHFESAAKEAAQGKFQTIQKAYDVLSDPVKRAAYDLYGESGLTNGLKSSSSQSSHRRDVGMRFKTPEEIREEYERVMREKAEMDVAQLVRSKGDISITLDATALFDKDVRQGRLSRAVDATQGEIPRQGATGRSPIALHAEIKPAPSRTFAGVPFPGQPHYAPPASPLSPSLTQQPQLKDHVIGLYTLVTSVPSLLLFQQSFVRHSWDTKWSPSTDFTVAGTAMTRRGLGSGSIAGTVKHVLDGGHGAVETTVVTGVNTVAMIKWVRSWSGGAFTTIQATTNTLSRPPAFIFVAGRQLFSSVTGFLTFRTGDIVIGQWGADANIRELSGISLGTMGRIGNGQWDADLSAGLTESHVSVAYSRSVGLPFLSTSPSLRIRVSAVLSTSSGVVISVSTTRKTTKYSRIGIGLDLSGNGVSVRFRWSRLGQRVTLPIVVSRDWDLDLALASLAVPLGLMWCVERFWVEPRRKNRIELKLHNLRVQNASVFEERKTSALEAQRLMRETVARKVELERSRNGLVIIKALYGRLEREDEFNVLTRVVGVFKGESSRVGSWMTGKIPGRKPVGANIAVGTGTGTGGLLDSVDQTEEDTEVLDVTVAIMSLVTNHQLHVSGGHPKSAILGFYDPSPGHAKQLLVLYQFGGKLHRVVSGDREALAAPVRAHIISPTEEAELDLVQDAWPAVANI
ncbi:hypothetical protein HDU93_008936 [Gonapodya sp. JEL0774]|nr:hypothetical protein HDU93_008936 [Gonapodya sp. JEL0774]